MKSLVENFGIALCGLATSILVAIADVVVARITGLDVFTISVLFAIPIGAVLTGFAAASGYYFGSLYFHKRAGKLLLVQMVVIAGFTQLLIYWLGYTTMVLDDGRKVADLIPFAKYLDLSLTSAHYRIGRAQTDTGEVGSFGYWLAAFQFVGFLFGGLAIYVHLLTRTICRSCNLYLRPLAKKRKTYANPNDATFYYEHLFSHPVDGEEFAALIRSDAKVAKPEAGAIQIDTALFGCPRCKTQMIEENLHAYNGKEWRSVDQLTRRVRMPEGCDIAPLFRS